jgi:hypothetical protein
MLHAFVIAVALSAEPKKPLDCGGYTEISRAEQPVPASHRRSPETCGAWRAAMAVLEAAKPKADGGK